MSQSNEGSIKVILFALMANFGIAVAKFTGAFYSKSASLLAEAIHSLADCTNQVFLLIGAKKSKKPADAQHPLGYGRENFFWSFLVALLLFFAGGVFAIYEGVHKLTSSEESTLTQPWIGVIILVVSIALEGGSFFACLKEVKKINRYPSLWQWFRESTASDLIVIFMEDFAALVGLVLALGFLLTAWITGDARWDAAGSICIGLILVVVAVLLGNEVKSLIVGEKSSTDYKDFINNEFKNQNSEMKLLKLISLATGSNEVMLALKVHPGTIKDSTNLINSINTVEAKIKSTFPEVKWIFAEPDLKD